MRPMFTYRDRSLAPAVVDRQHTIAAGLGPAGWRRARRHSGEPALGLFPALLPAAAPARDAGADGSRARCLAGRLRRRPEPTARRGRAVDQPLPGRPRRHALSQRPGPDAPRSDEYRHWFDGDGMVHAFRLDGTSLRHQARMIRTDKYVAEEKAGRFLRPASAAAIPDAPPRQQARRHQRRQHLGAAASATNCWRLWEAGSPWRDRPATLETLRAQGVVPETDGVAFSAHPKVDRDGTVWSFGYLAGSGKLVLYRLDPGGGLRADAADRRAQRRHGP